MSFIQTQARESWPGFFGVPVLAEPLWSAAEPVLVAMTNGCFNSSVGVVGRDEVGREQGAEHVGEFSLRALVLPDEEALEDSLVESPSNLLRRVPIGFVAVREERQA